MGEELKLDNAELKDSNEIVNEHLQQYLKKMTKVLFLGLLAITIAEIVIVILIKTGHFLYYLTMQNSRSMSFTSFVIEVLVHTLLLWLVYIIYSFVIVNASFHRKKVIFSITFMLITTLICFSHWKYSYLSILYSIPVCVVTPLGKKYSKSIFILSILIAIIYSFLQAYYFKTQYNFLIGVVSIVTIIIFFLISRIFYGTVTSAIYDVEKYCSLNTELTIKVNHDTLTGSFSKIALYKEFEALHNYKSMAFIDLDNFKSINDNQGHSIGDYILKALVRCFKVKGERIYRYGGDEFVILSTLDPISFRKELEEIKSNFVRIGNGVLNCTTSFSAGVVKIDQNDNPEILLRKCDRAMYVAKKSGKNSITISVETCDID